jgi:hypothetical protein
MRRIHDARRQLDEGPSIQARAFVHLGHGRDLRDGAWHLHHRSAPVRGCLHRPARRDHQSAVDRRSEAHNVGPTDYHVNGPHFALDKHHGKRVNCNIDDD